MYKGNVSRSSRGRAKYGIRFLLMLFITIGMVLIINHNIVIFTEASAPETGVWVITGTQTYSDHEYNVYHDIIIGDGADVTFSNCKFNFKNSTAVMEIKVNGTAKLRLDGCILNATGNNVYAHISALENSSLTITGSKLVNLGNNNYKGVESQAKYNYIRNNEITGSYNAIYIHQVTDGNVIIRDNMMDSGNYNNYYGIELYKLGNITLTNNTVIGYGTGLYISSIVENLTVEENNIFNTSYSGIYLNDFMSSGHNNWNSYSIRFNKLINTYYGLDVYNGNNGVIMNNSIESISSGISLSYISNLTVSNNKIVCKGKYYGYVGVSMSELTNVSIEHNSLEDGVKIQDESYELKFYSFNDYIKDLNISDNKINGKYALAYYNNQNGTYDFGGMLNIGEIYLYNISNGWLRNANITGASNLKLKNCNNMTISNLHIYNFSSALYISDSHNITLKDSIIGAAYKRIEYEVRVWYGTDIYFDNITLFNHNQSLYSRGMSIEWVNVFHLENSIIDGGYSTGVELSSVNHTLIRNNTIIAETFVYYGWKCFYGNISYNSLINTSTYINFIYIERNTGDLGVWDHNHWAANVNATDNDGDGICDFAFLIEDDSTPYIYDYHPLFIDGDQDKLDDFQEIYIYKTDPNDNDTDSDQIDDYEEVHIGEDGYITDPLKPDTDGDNLTDYEETSGKYGSKTDPTNPDTDGDLFTDYYEEIIAHSDPTDPNSFPGGYANDNNTEEWGEEEPAASKYSTATIPGYPTMVIMVILGIMVVSLARTIKKKLKLI